VPDPRMSVVHARFVRQGLRFVVEDDASHNGTRVNGARLTGPTPLEDGDLLEAGHTFLRYRAVVGVSAHEPADFDAAGSTGAALLPTLDPSFSRRVAALEPLAASMSPLLLLGETGTGKELLARAIHGTSGRRGPFVAVNCGALPRTLVESQLFGHVRGAFSGAVGDALGVLRSADRGTLLLDEIGDLPRPAQAALLRVLQEGEVVPVGSARPVRVDVRVVAATHRPLAAMAARGAFRRDLYARLAGFTFALPPVRERQDDIGLFVAAFARQRRIRFTAPAGCALLRYPWPLNVRELHHVLDVAAALAGEDPIRPSHLPSEVADCAASFGSAPPSGDPDEAALRRDLVAALERRSGNVSEVARDLGKQRRQVQRWMARLGIDADAYRAKS
ncbi:MAG TPA: sigma 54-interacting transcriptional regulator, partial [Polyangiaceae bacterium]|nr:sigma 54-interacting transcriptional regulator [Polyangiaceae bacterium]